MNTSGHYHWIVMLAEEHREKRLRELAADAPDFFGETEELTEPYPGYDDRPMTYIFVPEWQD